MSGPSPVKTLVVSAASRHGGTCEIADRIAATLTLALPEHWHVIRGELCDFRVFDDADAVVLGSAIYYGHWMHSAAKALDYLRDNPPTDLFLFSTGPISEIESENAQVISADALAALGEADEHMVFGGKLDTTHLSFIERIVVKGVHALPGDHRDWSVVDAWSNHIAAELGANPSRVLRGTKGTPGQGISP
ncbi:menaquinone-dependent protoporphyrinogen oxidase [Aeromicrobium panaciterrae]|uniref:Menaquinone-dependent protoporphyrinogen oxidase n=1 Tax=Aeromicrobium panaciterrae TaxID=363861 RepID=A0ABU1UJ61_9ACTN|nr:flavodoxin domain-containing protein [Aeromicrobium panaciterrae]MDR7085219.1 menaquinone-dependent protoporphyrinogen oxidase [Aeromicrobium panaciterrae]